MSDRFDLIVLGAGSGGLSVAQRAAKLGARVAMFDPGMMGGTCVNRGCVPKKAMWHAAHIADMHRLAAQFGFTAAPMTLDWARFRAQRDDYIAGIRRRYNQHLSVASVDVIDEAARLVAADTVVTASGRHASAPHIVVATGARPRHLDVPGFELGMVSDDIFALDTAPTRIMVVGGGYVAVEFACLLRALGCDVDLLMRETMLPHFDAELVGALSERMQWHGIRIVPRAQVKTVEGTSSAITVKTDDGAEYGTYDRLLWAVGRVPNSDDVGLEALGIARDDQGHIQVDAFQNTNIPGIYAVGDVTDRVALTPVAVAAGRALAERLFGDDKSAHLDDGVIPTVVFSDPPLGMVGLTESQARARYGDDIRVHSGRYTPLIYMVAGRPEQSAVKIVCAGDDCKVIGIHVLGPGSDELLQGFAVAMHNGLHWRDLKSAIAIHPTAAEELLLLS